MAGAGEIHKNLEGRHLSRKFIGESRLRTATASTREAGVQCACPGWTGAQKRTEKTWACTSGRFVGSMQVGGEV